MFEVVGNMHMHTPYSDGEKYHREIAQAAIRAGLDFIVVTDHNIWVEGIEGYVESAAGRVLMLVGEEVHDVQRNPQGNHLLIYGAEREVAALASDPQALINEVNQTGGLTFLAHPDNYKMPLFGGIPDLGWHEWEIEGYTGLEIWNYMSSFTNEIGRKVTLNAPDTLFNRLRALPLILNPERHIRGPEPATLARWDALLASGRRVVGIGSSNAHGTPIQLGFLHRQVFPYEFCFRAVNTHLQLPQPLTGDLATDKQMIFEALKVGHSWVGYDMPYRTRGFQFVATGTHTGSMGDAVELTPDTTLYVDVPTLAEIRIIRYGELMASVSEATSMTYHPTEPGAYRVECLTHYKGKLRGWIYSNPIYIEAKV